jgi:signal transduction histidine kinase/CheY-like chemotaxis protein
MNHVSLSLEDIPYCALLTNASGQIVAANGLAKSQFGPAIGEGVHAPWLTAAEAWQVTVRADGTQFGLLRPQANEAAMAKTMLFATLSHEIRTPLNGILGMAGLLATSELTHAQRSWLEAVSDSGQHLLGLLNDILDYAKLESGKIELETLVFNPAKTVQSVIELCSPRAHEKGLEIALVVTPDVPLAVAGDDGRLRQVILNLVSNAIKFTPQGGILVLVEAAHDGHLTFRVEDTGIGIPADKAQAVFDEFQQADSSHTRRFGGTGLGLAIVKKLTEAMGGSIALSPRTGGGSVFAVTLPLETVTPPRAQAQRLRDCHIVIATDSAFLAATIRLALRYEGAKASILGRAAQVTDAPPSDNSLLLLDHCGPDDAEMVWPDTDMPIVALIPQEKRDLIEPYRAKGAAGYLIKPLRQDSLIERILVTLGFSQIQDDPHARDERAQAAPKALGLRVLLAEDNPVNALLAKSLLARNGCHVDAVVNGAEAIAALQTAPYDLVLMDVHMPIMDGYAATTQIRTMGGRMAQTPIIALTAAAMEEDRRACLSAGMDDFITKPLDPLALSSVLERWTKDPRQANFASARGAG